MRPLRPAELVYWVGYLLLALTAIAVGTHWPQLLAALRALASH